jgi:type IV pilus assembly protein PilN
MIQINLLPVREERRKADVRQFAAMLGATFAGSVLLAMMVHGKLIADVVGARSSMAQLQAQIDQFKPQLEQVEKYRATKQAIESKLEVIGRLERSRSGPLHVLDELSVHSPERLWLTELEAKEARITVRGMSLDNELVALFMTALGDSPYFKDVELEETEAKNVDGLRLNAFELSAMIETPGDPEAPAPAPQANPPGKKGASPAATGR